MSVDPRFEPGARWENYGKPAVVGNTSHFQGVTWAHFNELAFAVELADLNEANGWRFVGPPEEQS